MKLRLVDRRLAVDVVPEPFRAGSWAQLERLASVVGVPIWVVDVVLVPDMAMIDLNRQYRQRPVVTDVLSFSYLASVGSGAPDLSRGDGHAATDLWLEVRSDVPDPAEAVGELVLAPAFVGDRCAAEGWSLAEEIPWLVVHGCLHLVGWDHEELRESQAMRDLEADILAGEGLPHPLRRRS